MNIEQLLTDAVVKAVKACYGADITPEQVQIQKTRPDFEGHLTVVTFPFLRISKRKPEDTGEDLALWLVENTDLVSTFNIVKGFLNLTIAPKKWIELLENIDADQCYGLATPGEESPLTMVEYSSPNTNKPCREDEYRQRPRYPHLQIHARLAEIRQRRHARVHR